MPTVETKVTVHARPAYSRDRLREHGVTGAEEDYGHVEVVRTKTTTRRADGDVGRVLGTPVVRDEVLATLSAADAAHLIKTLGTALVNALEVRPGFR